MTMVYMTQLTWLVLISLYVLPLSDAFVSPRAGLMMTPYNIKHGKRCCGANLVRTWSSTARKATSDDEDQNSVESPQPSVNPASNSSPIDAAKSGLETSPPPARPQGSGLYEGVVAGLEAKDVANETPANTDYPINLPAYLLLALSSMSCIAFIGSIFEVIGPKPQLGYTTTYIIGTLALPTFIFLFYAAIKKGQAEVDEDDAKFSGGF